MVEQLNKSASDRELVGCIETPSDGRTYFSKVSHKLIPNFRLENDQIVGEIEIIDSEAGRQLKSLITNDDPIGITIRSIGSVNEQGLVSITDIHTTTADIAPLSDPLIGRPLKFTGKDNAIDVVSEFTRALTAFGIEVVDITPNDVDYVEYRIKRK